MALQPSDTLDHGRFVIERVLGRGGFGCVYLARDTFLDEERAIKELIPALVDDETILKRYLDEARATMRLTHERIVRTFHVFPDRGNYYIVMEYMPGGSLEARLRERCPLPYYEAVDIAAEVCEGLAYSHLKGVVHCDLKPANILFDAGGHAKLGDFGIAHISQRLLSRSWDSSTRFFAGSLPYMSPEQTRGERDDPRLDVYALGAVLYEMLTGRTYLDFERGDTPAVMVENVRRIQERKPHSPSRYQRDLPPWLDGVVLKALAKYAAERYANAEEFRSALKPVGAGPARRSRRPPVWFWPAVGAAALVLLSIAALAVFGDGKGGTATTTPTPGTTSMALEMTERALSATYTPSSPIVRPSATRTSSTATHTFMPSVTPTPTLTPTKSPTNTATPTETPTPTNTPSGTPTSTPMPRPTVTRVPTVLPTSTSRPAPTRTPAGNLTLAAPKLAGPDDGQVFAADDVVLLQWKPVGPLPADGYYVVTLAYTHNGATWTDDTPWTRQAQWAVSEHPYLLDLSDDGRFRWSVRVMRQTGTDAQGRPTGVALSPASGERTFSWRASKPTWTPPTP